LVATSIPSVAAGTSKSVCHSSEVVLEGNAPDGNATGSWTVSPNAGISFSNSNDPHASVFGMQANTAYTFTWTIANQCQVETDNVVLTTGSVAGPSYADAGPNQCESTGTITLNMAGNHPAVGTGLWTILDGPNSPTITNETLYNTTVTGMVDGHYEIEWSINVPTCTSTKDTLFASIVTGVTTSDADDDKSVCGNSVVMTANSPAANETGHWEQVSGNSGYSISNISAHDATFSDLIPGRYEFSWIIEKGICPSSTDNLFITVSEQPDIAVTTSDYDICSGTNGALSANNPNAGNGVWSQIGTATNQPNITSINSPTTTVTGLATGEYQFRWTITTGADCSPEIDDIFIQVSVPAVAEPDRQLCNATETFLEGTDGTDGVWSISPANTGSPIPSISNTNVHTALATGMGLDETYTFRYTIPAIYSCPTSFDDLTISTSPYGTDPDAGPDQEICTSGGTSITMAANEPGTGTGSWNWISGPGTPTIASDTYNTLVSDLINEGVYIFEWNVNYGYCGNYSDVVRVNVYNPPTTSNAGTDQTNACQLNAQLDGNLPDVGIGTWTLISSPAANSATISIDNINTNNTSISDPSHLGTYTFRWTITNGTVCSVSTSDVDITFTDNPPSTPLAGNDQDLCDASTITMAGNDPVIGIGTWSQFSGQGGATISEPTVYNTAINGILNGTYEFKWTIVSGGCTLEDNMLVVNSATPPIANASATDPDICQFETPILIGNDASPGTGTWSVISGPTSPVITNPNNSTTDVTGTIPGTYEFRWTITNGACAPTNDDIELTIVNNPLTNLTVDDDEICNGTDGTVTINNSENAINYEAFVAGGSVGTVLGDGGNQFISVSAASLSTGTNYIDIKASNTTGCTVNLENQSTIVVNPNPDASLTVNGNTVCNGNNGTITIGNAENGIDYELFMGITPVGSASGSGSNLDITVSSANLSIGINTINVVATNPVTTCNSNLTNTGNITVDENPSTSDAGIDQDVCGTSAVMNGNINAIGVGAWSTPDGGIFADANSNSTSVSNLSTGLNTLTWTIANGVCNDSQDDVIIISYQNPTIADAGSNQDVCLFNATLAGNDPVIGMGNWTTTGGADFVNSTIYDTDVSNLDVGINTFTWTISNSAACPETSDDIIITTYQNPTVSDAGTNQEICGTDAVLNGNIPNVGIGTWTTSDGGIFADANSNSSSVSNLTIGTNTFNWTIANGVCTPTVSQVIVTAKQEPDKTLNINGNTVCENNDGIITIELSETNIDYEIFSGTTSLGTISGTGTNIDFSVLATNLNVGTNSFDIVATHSITSCVVSMDNQPTVTVNANPVIGINVSGNSVCDENNGTLSIIASENNINYEAYIGTTSVGTALGNGNDIEIIIDAADLEIGDNIVDIIATSPANCFDQLSNNAIITVNANPINDLGVSGGEICNGDSGIVTITSSENDIEYELFIDQISITTAVGTGNDLEIGIPYDSYSLGNNTINVTATNTTSTCSINMENEAEVFVEQCKIIVYDGFSPNDDGINETFIIEGLINFPNHKVTIFNRWGNKVYEASPYLNDWDGTNMFGVSVGGDKLPVGTYFYIIEPGDGSKALKGYIYLNK